MEDTREYSIRSTQEYQNPSFLNELLRFVVPPALNFLFAVFVLSFFVTFPQEPVSFDILDDGNSLFDINPRTGKVTVVDSGKLNSFADKIIEFTVRATVVDSTRLDDPISLKTGDSFQQPFSVRVHLDDVPVGIKDKDDSCNEVDTSVRNGAGIGVTVGLGKLPQKADEEQSCLRATGSKSDEPSLAQTGIEKRESRDFDKTQALRGGEGRSDAKNLQKDISLENFMELFYEFLAALGQGRTDEAFEIVDMVNHVTHSANQTMQAVSVVIQGGWWVLVILVFVFHEIISLLSSVPPKFVFRADNYVNKYWSDGEKQELQNLFQGQQSIDGSLFLLRRSILNNRDFEGERAHRVSLERSAMYAQSMFGYLKGHVVLAVLLASLGSYFSRYLAWDLRLIFLLLAFLFLFLVVQWVFIRRSIRLLNFDRSILRYMSETKPVKEDSLQESFDNSSGNGPVLAHVFFDDEKIWRTFFGERIWGFIETVRNIVFSLKRILSIANS